MAIMTIDLGGTTVKAGRFDAGQLTRLDQVATPADWPGLEAWLARLQAQWIGPLEGLAVSAPGSPDMAAGEIRGVSAIPYLHHWPIVAALRKRFEGPVVIENDANCVGYAESVLGAASGSPSTACLVIGTGVGGCLFLDGHLIRGAHHYGGEFGGLYGSDGRQFTVSASPVMLAQAYTAARQDGRAYTGQQVFAAAQAGEAQAGAAVAEFCRHVAEAIFAISLAVDPAMVVIGGALSQNAWLIAEIQAAVRAKMRANTTPDLAPQVVAAKFRQEANLIGAAVAWQQATMQ